MKEINITQKDPYENEYKKSLLNFINIVKEDISSRNLLKIKILQKLAEKLDREELNNRDLILAYKVLSEADSNLLTPIFSTKNVSVNQATIIKEREEKLVNPPQLEDNAIIQYSKLYSKTLYLEDTSDKEK